MIYRKVLKQALSITFNYKHLWFFGIFVAFLGGMGEYQFVLNAFNKMQQSNPLATWWNDFIAQVGVPGSVIWQGFKQTLMENPLQLAGPFFVLLSVLVILLFVIWLVIVSQGSLINGLSKIYKNKNSAFADNLKTGMDNFAPMLGYNILERLLAYILILAVGLLTFALSKSNIYLGIILIVLMIAAVLLVLIVSFVIKYAICYYVIYKEKFWEAVKSALVLFKENWLVSVETAIILLAISGVAFIVLIFLTAFLSLPFFIIMVICSLLDWTGIFLVFLALGVLTLFAFMLLYGSWLAVFQWSTWVIIFTDLDKKRFDSKIMRVAQSVFGNKIN